MRASGRNPLVFPFCPPTVLSPGLGAGRHALEGQGNGDLKRQSARSSLYSKCADSQNSLTQNLQFAAFFAATSYGAKRKKKWKILRVVRRLRSGRASLPVGWETTSPGVAGPGTSVPVISPFSREERRIVADPDLWKHVQQRSEQSTRKVTARHAILDVDAPVAEPERVLA